MNSLRLEKRVPEKNQFRFYRLVLHPTLFGEWSLVREWGRIGRQGRVVIDTFCTPSEARLASDGKAAEKSRSRLFGTTAMTFVLACDLVVAAEGATFAVTPAKLGVPYNAGGMLTFLNAAGLRLAKEMIFAAQPLDAIRAERLGLVNRVVPAVELEAVTLCLAQQIAANAPWSVAVMKEQLRILAGAHPMTRRASSGPRGCAAWSTTARTTGRGSVPSRRSAGPGSRASDRSAPSC